MPISEDAKVILFKLEGTEGADANPAAADAILTRNFSSNPIETDTLERNIDRPTVGGSNVAITNPRQSHNFEVEMAGSGTAQTQPKWMRLLEACGMAAPVEDVGPPAQTTQAFDTAPFASGTLYHWYDDQRRRALMTRGTFGGNLTAGQYPFLSFGTIGLLPTATPFDKVAAPTPDFSAFQAPVEVNTDNTSFTLDSFAAVLRSLEFAANVNVALRNLVGSRRVNRGNHGITGTATIEAPDVATKNYLDTLKAGSEIALQIVHGTQAGNIVQIDMPQCQLTGVNQSEEDDILMYAFGFRANVSAGSDDLTITTK